VLARTVRRTNWLPTRRTRSGQLRIRGWISRSGCVFLAGSLFSFKHESASLCCSCLARRWRWRRSRPRVARRHHRLEALSGVVTDDHRRHNQPCKSPRYHPSHSNAHRSHRALTVILLRRGPAARPLYAQLSNDGFRGLTVANLQIIVHGTQPSTIVWRRLPGEQRVTVETARISCKLNPPLVVYQW